MSMYQLVAQEPGGVGGRGRGRSLLREVGPSHSSVRTASPITNRRDAAHASTGARQRGHHASRASAGAASFVTAGAPVPLAGTLPITVPLNRGPARWRVVRSDYP